MAATLPGHNGKENFLFIPPITTEILTPRDPRSKKQPNAQPTTLSSPSAVEGPCVFAGKRKTSLLCSP